MRTPEMNDCHWMTLALEEAGKVTADVPVGCLIVLNHQVIGRGHNQREALGDPTAHAEIVAIKEAAAWLKTWRLSGTTLYTTLEPCAMCAEALIQARVSRLVFGAYDNYSGAAGSAFNLFVQRRIYPVPEVLGGILEEPCKKLLVEHFCLHSNR